MILVFEVGMEDALGLRTTNMLEQMSFKGLRRHKRMVRAPSPSDQT